MNSRFCSALAIACPGALLMLSGCSTPASFMAVAGENGRLGKYYEIEVDGRNWGDARVWSRGARPDESDRSKAVVEMDLRLSNDSREPLTMDLDRIQLEVVTEGASTPSVHAPVRTSGPASAPPGSTVRMELFFELPGVVANDIESLDLLWVVQTPAGPFSQSTPFVRDRGYEGAYGHAFYSPWYAWSPSPYSYHHW